MSCYAPPQVPSQPGRSLAPVYNLLLAFGWCPLDGDHHSSGAAITADLSREMLVPATLHQLPLSLSYQPAECDKVEFCLFGLREDLGFFFVNMMLDTFAQDHELGVIALVARFH